jgi:hypothetical protein
MKLLPSRSGIARSGATRSGWPVLVGTKVPLYALSKVARSGATRSNYHSTKPFIAINGVPYGSNAAPGTGILVASLTVNESINHTPSTGAMTVRGIVPVEGADVIITLGSINNLKREFGGTILSTNHHYLGKPAPPNMVYDAALIDYTWGLNRRKVSALFTNTTVAAIAASLMTYTTGGYTLQVDADIGAELIDVMTFTEQDLTEAWSQLTKRVGGDWNCTYTKVVHLFFEDVSQTAPTMLNAVHLSLRDLAWVRDLSPVITRCLGEFGGSDALEQLAPGAAQIPVITAAWYLAAGGVVLVGQQRVNYTGLDAGGRGSLVGPGASPSSAINAAVVPGTGIEVGVHSYAVTYTTAVGECTPSPLSTVNVGVVAVPTAAPALGTPVLGSGPEPGLHVYAVTFMIASGGETTPGPSASVSSGVTQPPTTAPTPAAGAIGAGPDDGTHDYAVSFGHAAGETTPGPISGAITIGGTPIPAPGVPTVNAATAGGAVTIGSHTYCTTFLTARGETTAGATAPGATGMSASTRVPNPTQPPGCTATTTHNGNAQPVGTYETFCYAYRTSSGETLWSPANGDYVLGYVNDPNSGCNINVTVFASPDSRVTQIAIYHGYPGVPGYWQLEMTLSNITTTVGCGYYGAGSVSPPSSNTTPGTDGTPLQTIPISGIPTGPAGVYARNVYRSKAGTTSPMLLLVTFADNSTTSYNDTKADSALGTNTPPLTNTALVTTAVHLTSIPRGTGVDANVGYRNLYRRSGGAGLRLLAQIADNTSTTYDDTKANAALGVAPPTVNGAALRQIPITNIPLGNAMVTARNLYRSAVGGGPLKLIATFWDNTTTTWTDLYGDASLAAAAPTVNTAIAQQVQLSAIPIGATTVTSRKLYRTAAGAAQLKLLKILADNVTTAWLDAAADATLGANVPTSDTSSLAQPSGNVLAGSSSLLCASVAGFLTAGGWAQVGSQVVRYTGISGNSLIGIPVTGPGSISATISYNSTVVAAPMLTGVPTSGIGAIKYPVLKGDQVNIFVQVDDLAAQAAVRAQIPGSDGVIENEIQDRRLSYTEGVARCQAQLELLAARDVDGKVGVITVNYVSRDINTHAGRPIGINLGPPINLRGTFLIQRVSITKFYIPHLNPTYTVQASSLRFTYDELLRLIKEVAS